MFKMVYRACRDNEYEAVKAVVDEQAEDEGLWFTAQTATEAYLQAALRRLHAVFETANDGVAFKLSRPDVVYKVIEIKDDYVVIEECHKL